MTGSRHTILSPDSTIGVQQKEGRANCLGRLGIVNLGILAQGLFLVVQRFQLRLNRLDRALIGVVQFLKLRFQLDPLVGQLFELGRRLLIILLRSIGHRV